MYVFKHPCTYVCMYVCMYVGMYVCMNACKHHVGNWFSLVCLHCEMPHCVAFGCSNDAKKKADISFHVLPGNKCQAWIQAIGRTELPANLSMYVCMYVCMYV